MSEYVLYYLHRRVKRAYQPHTGRPRAPVVFSLASSYLYNIPKTAYTIRVVKIRLFTIHTIERGQEARNKHHTGITLTLFPPAQFDLVTA